MLNEIPNVPDAGISPTPASAVACSMVDTPLAGERGRR
jgi:hypothetical protein